MVDEQRVLRLLAGIENDVAFLAAFVARDAAEVLSDEVALRVGSTRAPAETAGNPSLQQPQGGVRSGSGSSRRTACPLSSDLATNPRAPHSSILVP